MHWLLSLTHLQTEKTTLPDITLKGDASDSVISISEIFSEAWPTTLHLLARYQWSPFPQVDATIQGKVNPGLWSKKWPGNLDMNIATHWQQPVQSENTGWIKLNQLQGNLQNQSIDGHGALLWNKDHVDFQDWKLLVGKAIISISGILSQDSHLHWTIHIPQLSFVLPMSSGQIMSQGDIQGNWQNPQLSATLQALALRAPNLSVQSLVFQAANQSTQAHSFVTNLQVQNAIVNEFTLHTLQIKGNGSLQAPMTQLNLQGAYQAWLPDWQNMNGRLDIKIETRGSLPNPRINVLAHLHEASVYWVSNNLTITPIDLLLQGWLDDALKVTASIGSGGGRLQAQGQIQHPLANPDVQLHLTGNQILASDLFSYQIWITPTLDLHYQHPDFTLTGNLLIPKALLNFTQYSDNVQSLTSDVVYADEQKTDLNFASHILLQLGNDIHLRYGGLTGRLTGQLQLNQLNADAQALGAINLVDGKYKAYGQSLTIQKGVANYANTDVNNPELNIQAVKVLHNTSSMAATGNYLAGAPQTAPDGTLTVGIEVTGPLLRHRIELFSQPAGLSQSDILSYLVLGVPSSQADNSGAQLLMTAASALGGNTEGNTVTKLQEQLKRTFGIDVNVGSVSQYDPSSQSTTQSTALILTKALSPRLYVSYSAAVGQEANIFNVRYQLTKSWMAQTESSALGNGADIFYTIDR